MIRNLLATTAIASLLVSGAAYAQTTPPAPTDTPAATSSDTPMVKHADGQLASNLIGEEVYNSTADDAEKIGEVVDLVLSDDGNVEAIVVGVGGFLGIGQKDVALEYNLVEWAEQTDGDRWIVVATTKDALEAQEEFDRAAFKPMPADADVGKTTPVTASDLNAAPASTDSAASAPAPSDAPAPMASDSTAPVDTTAPADTAANDAPAAPDAAGNADTNMAQSDTPAVTGAPDTSTTTSSTRPDSTAVDRNTLTEVPAGQISADKLVGTTVYGANEENVGEINDVVLSEDGKVDAIIIDVGGFLGIGEKPVAVGMDNLAFMADEDGDQYLYTEFTKEQLEAQPAYDEATYTEQRDQMRLNVQ